MDIHIVGMKWGFLHIGITLLREFAVVRFCALIRQKAFVENFSKFSNSRRTWTLEILL
jgi:hypothetical protein